MKEKKKSQFLWFDTRTQAHNEIGDGGDGGDGSKSKSKSPLNRA